jgi:hypothetical protein
MDHSGHSNRNSHHLPPLSKLAWWQTYGKVGYNLASRIKRDVGRIAHELFDLARTAKAGNI